MEKQSYSGRCIFDGCYDFEQFKKELKFGLLNGEISNVTVHKMGDGSAFIVHEWADTEDDLRFSHMISKKIAESFGGKYTIDND